MDHRETPGGPQEPQRSGYPSREQDDQPTQRVTGGYTPSPTDANPPPSGGYTPPPMGYNPPPTGGYAPPSAGGYAPPPPAGYAPPSGYAAPAPTTQLPDSQNTPPVQYGTVGNYSAQPYSAPGGYAANPLVRDPNIAAVVEIVPGLFGLLGIGHLAAGRITSGVVLLAASLLFIALGWIVILPFIVLTCGLGFCLLPLLWILPIASGLWLRKELMKQPIGAYRP